MFCSNGGWLFVKYDKVDYEAMKKENPFAVLWVSLYDYLKKEILYGKLKPGEKLNLSKISEELGVSRSPVVMALNKLYEDGYVNREHSKYSISGIDANDLVDLIHARIAIEKKMAELAAQKITPEKVKKLKKLIYDFEIAQETKNRELFYETDTAFHNLIAEIADSPYLLSMYRNLQPKILRYRYLALSVDDKQAFLDYNANYHKSTYFALVHNHVYLAGIEMENDLNRMMRMSAYLTVSE